MILTHDTILEEIRGGNIKIEPFCEDCAGPGSVDLHLGNAFRVFKNRRKVFPVTEEAGFEEITVVKEIKNGKSIVLKSGETILGITQERFTSPRASSSPAPTINRFWKYPIWAARLLPSSRERKFAKLFLTAAKAKQGIWEGSASR